MKERIKELAFITTGRVAGNKNVSAVEKMISETITLAVNEALELAAKECETNSPKPFTTGGIIERSQCAEAIRKLKVKE